MPDFWFDAMARTFWRRLKLELSIWSMKTWWNCCAGHFLTCRSRNPVRKSIIKMNHTEMGNHHATVKYCRRASSARSWITNVSSGFSKGKKKIKSTEKDYRKNHQHVSKKMFNQLFDKMNRTFFFLSAFIKWPTSLTMTVIASSHCPLSYAHSDMSWYLEFRYLPHKRVVQMQMYPLASLHRKRKTTTVGTSTHKHTDHSFKRYRIWKCSK